MLSKHLPGKLVPLSCLQLLPLSKPMVLLETRFEAAPNHSLSFHLDTLLWLPLLLPHEGSQFVLRSRDLPLLMHDLDPALGLLDLLNFVGFRGSDLLLPGFLLELKDFLGDGFALKLVFKLLDG